MTDFKDLPAIDRRRFLAGFLATAASAGVLGKLGYPEGEYEELADFIYRIEPMEMPFGEWLPNLRDIA